jgi:hypothetical protein
MVYELTILIQCVYVFVQSDGVQSSVLTIIPVHDDNIDLEYEPVSSALIYIVGS